MKTLKDLFEHQLKDLWSAEDQLSDTIPQMKQNASDSKLRNAFESHLEQTKTHKERIESICNDLGISPTGEKCKAMEGLIKETKSFIDEDADSEVRDAGLIADAQRIAHYEISGYGTAARFARELGMHQHADKLQENLNWMYNIDEKLNDMAEQRLNEEAIA